MSHPSRRAPTLTAQEAQLPADHPWAKLPLPLVVLGAVLLGASWLLGRSAPAGHLAHAYLVAFVFSLTIALGALFFVLVQFAARAGWSVVVRRLAEHVMATLPLFVVLFVPVLLSMHTLYHHWMDTAAVAKDPLLTHKSGWLNETFFQIRSAVYLFCWAAIAVYFYRRSVGQDASGAPGTTRRLEIVSAPALVLFALTVSFAAFDWLMSLDPHWYSTIWGVYVFAGAVVSAYALLSLLAVGLARGRAVRPGVVTVEHLHDLGKLLFAFTCFWAYIAFSQFLLYWYGNIPEETIFYARRWFVVPEGAAQVARDWPASSWRTVSILLAVAHFVVPFFFLMPRTVKRSPTLLVVAAVWMLLVHWVDLYWIVMPNLHRTGVVFHAVDVTTWLGVFALLLGATFWSMRSGALVPVGDPRLRESLEFENF